MILQKWFPWVGEPRHQHAYCYRKGKQPMMAGGSLFLDRRICLNNCLHTCEWILLKKMCWGKTTESCHPKSGMWVLVRFLTSLRRLLTHFMYLTREQEPKGSNTLMRTDPKSFDDEIVDRKVERKRKCAQVLLQKSRGQAAWLRQWVCPKTRRCSCFWWHVLSHPRRRSHVHSHATWMCGVGWGGAITFMFTSTQMGCHFTIALL